MPLEDEVFNKITYGHYANGNVAEGQSEGNYHYGQETQTVNNEETHTPQMQYDNIGDTQQVNASTEATNDFAVLKGMMKPFDTSTQVTHTEFIGGLFPRGYVSVIVAPPGTGKSLAVQKIFTDLSNGGKFLVGSKGDETSCFKDNEPQRKCIILCGELGEQGLRERASTFYLHPKQQNVVVLDQTSY